MGRRSWVLVLLVVTLSLTPLGAGRLWAQAAEPTTAAAPVPASAEASAPAPATPAPPVPVPVSAPVSAPTAVATPAPPEGNGGAPPETVLVPVTTTTTTTPPSGATPGTTRVVRTIEVADPRTLTAADLTAPGEVAPRVIERLIEREPEPAKTTADVNPDDELLDDIQRRLNSDVTGWQNLRATVSSGMVKLSGTAPEKRDIETAAAMVSEVADFYGEKYSRKYTVYDKSASVSTNVQEVGAAKLGRLQALWEGTLDRLPLIVIAALVLLLAGVLAWLISIWKQPYDLLGIAPLTSGLIRRVAATVLVVAAILVAVELLDISALLGAVLGAAGVLGIALGFAFRDIIENYLAGLLLSLRHPFAMNDLLRLGEFEGKVVRLTSRETVLMTLDGNHVRIPNAMVFKSTLINYTANPLRRFDFVVGVDTEADLVAAQEIGADALLGVPGVLEHPAPFAQVDGIGESNVPVRFFGWVDQTQADFLKVRSAAVRLVKVAMDRAGIAMPEPTYQVRLQHVAHALPTLDVGDLDVDPEGEGEDEQDSLLRFPGIFAPAWGTTAAEDTQGAEEGTPPGAGVAATPGAGVPGGPKLAGDKPRVDVSPDLEVDRQIAREREESDEANLLETRRHEEEFAPDAEVERRKQSG